ncbi:MAG: ATP-binding protein, partial [Christensenellales bacterium]
MSIVNEENILDLLYSYNPWWRTGIIQKDFNKPMKRFAYFEAVSCMMREDIRRSVVLCGARRTGKTTIMYQAIAQLLQNGVLPKNILFVSFDHPLLKLCSVNTVIETYRANISASETIYCFFDEIQYASDWNTWLKILYDTNPRIKIMATGSASPILSDKISESGLGRWKVIHVPTLSFYEYCELLEISVPPLPQDIKPTKLFLRDEFEQREILHKLSMLQVHFIRYLQVGGFPELAISKDDLYAQRILREDIVDKALKRDIPAIYGVRNISDIERIFLYLCYNSSNIINIQTMSKEMDGVSRNTIEKYIQYLESASLIYISPLVTLDAKKILKNQNKIYIADAAMRNAVLMKDDITNDLDELGIIAETAVYKHIKAFYYEDAPVVGYY